VFLPQKIKRVDIKRKRLNNDIIPLAKDWTTPLYEVDDAAGESEDEEDEESELEAE
jgi:hypothetical protein